MRTIADQYSVSKAAIIRHRDKHLPAALIDAQAANDQVSAIQVTAELTRLYAKVGMLLDACDRWLRDPEDPTRYDVGARSTDIQVIYTEDGPNGKPVRRKRPLSALLGELQQEGLDVALVEARHADPRDLLLKTAAQLREQLAFLANLTEVAELKDRVAKLEERNKS